MKKTLYVIFSYYFIQGMVHNLGHPITPTYVNDLGLNPRMFGFFFSFMALGIVVGSLFWGVLGDRYKNRPLIFFGLFSYSIAQVGFGTFSDPVVMTMFRFLAGFSVSSSITLLLAYTIYHSPDEDRVKNIAITAALIALGTTFGYQIGGLLGNRIIREVFYVQALANLVYALYVGVTYKEFDGKHVNRAKLTDQFKTALTLKPPLLIFLVGLSLATIAATNLSKYLDVYIIDSGYTPAQLGTFVLVTGIVGILTNFFLVPQVAKLNKNMWIMRYLQVASALIIVVVFQITPLMLALYTLFLVYVMAKSMFEPLEKNYISLSATPQTYASLMGVRQMFFSIGMVLGPLISGFLYEVNPLFVFYFSSVMFALAFVLLTWSDRHTLKQNGRLSPKSPPLSLDEM